MSEDTFENIDNAESGSPEQIAKQLYSKKPGDSCSICLLPYSESLDNDAASFNFEILLTIYFEGFMNILDVIKLNYLSENMIDNNIKDFEIDNKLYKNTTIDDLKSPEPWFRSFGYTIIITEYGPESKREFNNKIKPLSYCRALLSFDPKDRLQFLIKGIPSRYTFILNGSYKPTSDLEKIYAILSKNDNYYKISFKRCILTGTIKDKCGF